MIKDVPSESQKRLSQPSEDPSERAEHADGVRHMLLGAVLVGLLLIVLQTLSPVLVPFLQAAFLTVIAERPVAWLRRRRLGQFVSVLVVVTGLVLILALIGTLAAASLSDFGTKLPVYERRVETLVDDAQSWLNNWGLELPVFQQIDGLIEVSSILRTAAVVGQQLGTFLGHTIFVVIIVVFALLEVPHLKERIESESGGNDSDSGGFRQFTSTINSYLIIKTWISLGTGVTLGSLFFLIGVDYALLWGIFAFILNYIPNIGSIVAAVPPVALAFFQFGTTWGLIVLVICVLVNLLFASIMEPRFLGRGLSLSPVIILFSLVTWGWVFGVTGIFLAVPLTVAVRLMLEKREETHWIAVLLGKPYPSPTISDDRIADS